jgi:hypothetical protein
MLLRLRSLSCSSARWAGAALCLLLGGLTLAQGPQNVSFDDLDKQERKYRETLKGLLNGETPADPANKEHKEALDWEAQWVTYRFAYTEFQTPGDPRKSIDKVYREVESDVASLNKNREKTRAAAKLYVQLCVVRAKEVLKAPLVPDKRRSIARVNVARALAKLAELGQGELADCFLEMIKDPPDKNQGVQYWAFRGLQELQKVPPPADGPPVLTPEQQQAVAQTLTDFIAQKVAFPKESALPEEIAGYQALRREAVRALALGRTPSHGEKCRPALTLLRVLADQDQEPPARLDERLEAAIGLARIRPAPKDTDYSPDYAVSQIAGLAAELASAYQEKKPHPQFPFRTYAARLVDELEPLRAERMEAKDAYTVQAIDEALKQLVRIVDTAQANPSALRDWLEGHRPPSERLFKSVADSAVKPRAAPNP